MLSAVDWPMALAADVPADEATEIAAAEPTPTTDDVPLAEPTPIEADPLRPLAVDVPAALPTLSAVALLVA